MAEKKRADYSESAENLVNPPEVKELLDKLHQAQATIAELDSLLIENETYKALKAETDLVSNVMGKIKEAIEAHGSYQDLEAGEYAVKYRRISKSYNAEKFAEFFPNYAPAVIIQVVNEAALEGLVKGKLITEEELKNTEVTQEKIGYAFYIR